MYPTGKRPTPSGEWYKVYIEHCKNCICFAGSRYVLHTIHKKFFRCLFRRGYLVSYVSGVKFITCFYRFKTCQPYKVAIHLCNVFIRSSRRFNPTELRVFLQVVQNNQSLCLVIYPILKQGYQPDRHIRVTWLN